MRRVAALGVPLAVVLALVVSGTALAAATHDVSIANFAFSPDSTKAKLGDSVRWTNMDGFAHTSTSDGVNDGSGLKGIGLWHSASIPHNGTFTFAFTFAGTFPYHCSIHPTLMTGTVKVPMKAKPTSGGVGTNFTITWATETPTGTLVFDVQRMDPGGKFKAWQTGVTTKSAKFKPMDPGTYQFRALLRDTSNGAKSKYSPVVKITVS
jgi:plastocyanin